VQTTFRRAIAGLAIVLGLTIPLAASPAAAASAGGNKDNAAVAVNTKDGSSLFRFAFNIAKVTGSTVDSTNTAIAYASCTKCQTVAIAIQFVIVQGSPDVFVPQNVAVALNEKCSMCDTLASAYQFVIQVSGPVRLSWEGRKQMWGMVKEIKALADSGLTGPEIQAKVDAIAKRMYAVMSTQLVPIPPDEGNDEHLDSTTTIEAPTTSAAPSSTTTSSKPANTTTTAQRTTTTTPAATTTSSSTTSSTTTSTP
jgi:putative peptide zinc metalloprotease protein